MTVHLQRHPSKLKISIFNANNIKHKKEEITEFLADYEIDILLTRETCLKAGDRFKLPNHVVYKNDRDGGGGGTAIIVKNTFNYCEMEPARTSHLENTRGHLEIGNTCITILSVYRQPHVPISDEDLEAIFEENNTVLAAGDYNAKHQIWNSTKADHEGRKIANYAQDNSTECHGPDKPTRYHHNQNYTPDVIDFCLTKNFPYPINTEVLHELSSDHLPVVFTIQINYILPDTPTQKFINWPLFKHYLLY